MAKKNQPAGQGGDNNEIFMIIGVLLIAVIVWWAFKHRIAGAILGVRTAEVWVISLFTSELDALRDRWLPVIDRRAVTLGDLYKVSDIVGGYIRWVATPVLAAAGIYLMRKSPTEKFRRKFTDETLPLAEADLYPWMKISTKIDFLSMDVEKGAWAYALTERQFARLHKLKKDNGQLDRERAESVFVRQLGGVWLSYRNLKPHARGLFALFAARANKDFKAGDALLMQLASSAADGKLDLNGVDELAAKYMESQPVKAVLKAHAYERTVLMSLLERARGGESGKDYLPPNWFLWLKGIDRPLWYALADVGRKTPHAESAGVFAHWLVEKARKRRLEMPYVRNAVDGLEIELAKFTDNDDLGFSDKDELLEPAPPPPAPDIPSPEEAERQRKERAAARAAAQRSSARDGDGEDEWKDIPGAL